MDGGFAEYIAVKPHMLFKASPDLPDEYVALSEIYGIGFHANNRAGTRQGDSLAIWGAGRVGQVILQAARTCTQETIFMVDPIDSRLQIAAENYENSKIQKAFEMIKRKGEVFKSSS
jgi:threonine dehydrogenase-like Zn-dependent dehydrogenase